MEHIQGKAEELTKRVRNRVQVRKEVGTGVKDQTISGGKMKWEILERKTSGRYNSKRTQNKANKQRANKPTGTKSRSKTQKEEPKG